MSRTRPSADWVTLCAPSAPAIEPGVPQSPICGHDPHPPAVALYLLAADVSVLRAALGAYANCGHMVDGADTGGRNFHRQHVVFAPATTYAVLRAVRCGVPGATGAAQGPAYVSDSGGTPVDMRAYSPFLGTEPYMETGAVQCETAITTTGTDCGGAGATRAIAVAASASPQVLVHEVRDASGWCFEPIAWVQDIETL